jgi:hypothetical protein
VAVAPTATSPIMVLSFINDLPFGIKGFFLYYSGKVENKEEKRGVSPSL